MRGLAMIADIRPVQRDASRIVATASFCVLLLNAAFGIMAVPASADTAITPSFTTAGKLTTLRVQMGVTANAAGVFVSPTSMAVTIPKGMVLNTAALPTVCPLSAVEG